MSNFNGNVPIPALLNQAYFGISTYIYTNMYTYIPVYSRSYSIHYSAILLKNDKIVTNDYDQTCICTCMYILLCV